MIESRLFARLRTYSENVYPLAAPIGYLVPAVVYNRVSTETIRDIDTDVQGEGWVTFQIDVYSTKYLESKTVARAIRDNLKSWKDADTEAVAWIDEKSSIDDTTEVSLYRVMMFFKLFCTDL